MSVSMQIVAYGKVWEIDRQVGNSEREGKTEPQLLAMGFVDM
jgi:hypothetical protein